MARELKPFKVDEVSNFETGVKVLIYLDRGDKTFFGIVGDKRVEAKTADECKSAVYKELQAFRPFVWEKVIEASTNEVEHVGGNPAPGEVPEDRHSTHIELHFRRYQQAKSLAGEGYIERGFDTVKEDFESPFRKKWVHNWRDNGSVALPYTDETWGKLIAIEAGIEELNRRLSQLLDPKDGAKRLLALQVRALLPAAPTRREKP
jgi:hypothetical protein